MIIVDTALKAREEQGKPIRVGMIGAGFMGQGLTNQIVHSVPGMRMAAIYNRKPERAQGVYRYAGCEDAKVLPSQASLDEAVRRGLPAVAEDPYTICRSPEVIACWTRNASSAMRLWRYPSSTALTTPASVKKWVLRCFTCSSEAPACTVAMFTSPSAASDREGRGSRPVAPAVDRQPPHQTPPAALSILPAPERPAGSAAHGDPWPN